VSLLSLKLKPGEPIFDQIVFAATKAFVSAEYVAGQPFPSVRTLATELKIHPNTAQKIIQHLIRERFLEARPGMGTIVADLPTARAGDRKRLLKDQVTALVVEALRVGAHPSEVHRAINEAWEILCPEDDFVKEHHAQTR
jgi:GntR family transcriptional regulator